MLGCRAMPKSPLRPFARLAMLAMLGCAANAAAIASLRGDVGEIESDVDALICDMQASIREADAFLATLEKP